MSFLITALILDLGHTLCFVSNETKDEDIVQHRDVVESRAIAHMKDIEKLFFVLKFHESRSNSLSFTKI